MHPVFDRTKVFPFIFRDVGLTSVFFLGRPLPLLGDPVVAERAPVDKPWLPQTLKS